MNLRAEMRSFAEAHPGREAIDLAEMFVRGVHADDLLPLLIDEFKQLQRAEVRFAEIEALRSSVRPVARFSADRLGDLAPLLNEPYRVGDGASPRRLGAMTLEEHTARLLMLEADIAGLRRGVEIHTRAIELIREHGVSCLDEIADRTLVAA